MKYLLAKVYRYAYPIAVAWWFLRRPVTEGVRTIIKHDNKVLLIKHTYGKPLFTVPGGGRHKNETIEEAAARESFEEVGLSVKNIQLVASIPYREEFKRDTIHICTAEVADPTVTIDPAELTIATWYPIDSLPENISPILKEYL
jgi:ADP-ribose pyrophosphatase YjhB (NUDIX family)